MRTTAGEVISWIGFGLIGLSMLYSLYLSYYVYIDDLLTARQKLMYYWPTYSGFVVGWILIKIGVKYDK